MTPGLSHLSSSQTKCRTIFCVSITHVFLHFLSYQFCRSYPVLKWMHCLLRISNFNGKFFKYKCYEIGYPELLEKVIFFQEIIAHKNLFFWKSSCLEKVTASKKCMFWIITYSGVNSPPKQNTFLRSSFSRQPGIQALDPM